VVDAKKSVQLAPGSADVAELASFTLASAGHPEEAVLLIEKAMALSPNYPALYLGSLGNAYRLAGRLDEAIAAFKAYNAQQPGFGLTDLVIAYLENGQADEAKQTAKRLLTARRDFTITSWLKTQFRRDTARLEADVAALNAAGLPID
jgi:adenylate cyclase